MKRYRYPPEIRNVLRYAWSLHRCFVCENFGPCRHRQPEVELELHKAKLRKVERKMMGRESGRREPLEVSA